MDNEENKYFSGIKFALRKLAEIGVPVTPIIKAVMNAESELQESEDERIRKYLIDVMKTRTETSFVGMKEGLTKTSILAWLEKQKEQKPAEWSEEDKVMLNMIEYRLKDWDNIKTQQGYQDDYTLPSPIKWLKSLRPHWKPSEEQMNELRNVISLIATPNKVILDELYRDLKN